MNRLLLLGAALALLPNVASAETLHDAIAAALTTNPTVAAAEARQQALAETPEQARATGRLTVSADSSAGYQRYGYGRGADATINAVLPIWSGGRVRSAVRAASSDVAAGAENLRDTTASVLQSVVTAYADLLYDQQAVEIAEADIKLLDSQVAELQARYKLGTVTKTDVARLAAQRASAVASLANAHAALDIDRATYLALVGHDPGELAPAPEIVTALPGTLDQARSRALASNSLYLASQQATRAAAARIDQARANGAPSLSLQGGYGYATDLARGGDRGYPETAAAGIALHVPILTGGLVASQVREADAQYHASRYDADAAGREATRSADSAWAALASAKAQAAANEQSVTAATLALQGVRAEYAFALRSTLDILVADESLRGAQLALARNRSDALIAEAALLRATGYLDPDAFG